MDTKFLHCTLIIEVGQLPLMMCQSDISIHHAERFRYCTVRVLPVAGFIVNDWLVVRTIPLGAVTVTISTGCCSELNRCLAGRVLPRCTRLLPASCFGTSWREFVLRRATRPVVMFRWTFCAGITYLPISKCNTGVTSIIYLLTKFGALQIAYIS